MNILKFTRFGDNFNYRRTYGIQWPFYCVVMPLSLDKQINVIHKPKWEVSFFNKHY